MFGSCQRRKRKGENDMNAIISFLLMLYAEQLIVNQWNSVPSYIENRALRLRNHEEEF